MWSGNHSVFCPKGKILQEFAPHGVSWEWGGFWEESPVQWGGSLSSSPALDQHRLWPTSPSTPVSFVHLYVYFQLQAQCPVHAGCWMNRSLSLSLPLSLSASDVLRFIPWNMPETPMLICPGGMWTKRGLWLGAPKPSPITPGKRRMDPGLWWSVPGFEVWLPIHGTLIYG